MRWQLQDAKQKFSQLVQQALHEGPQIVTRRGEDAVVVISMEQYQQLTGHPTSFKEFLMSFPDAEGFEIERSRELPRDVDL